MSKTSLKADNDNLGMRLGDTHEARDFGDGPEHSADEKTRPSGRDGADCALGGPLMVDSRKT